MNQKHTSYDPLDFLNHNTNQSSTKETKILLVAACQDNGTYQLEAALRSGISPNTDIFPLLMTCLNKHKKDHVDLLLNRGATVRLEHIFKSISLHDVKLFKRLIHQYQTIASGFNCNEQYDNKTLLHEAGRTGSPEIVETLIAMGANLEAKDDFGYTPIFMAIASKNIPVIKALHAQRANIYKINKAGETAFSKLQAILPDIAEEITNGI